MLVKIGQRSDHGFNEPLGLLSDCHRRIEQFLSVLVTIANVRQGAALNEPDTKALEGALRYFDTAAPRHSADEEESLFPRLRATGDSAACDALARLEADHRAAEEHHAAVHLLGHRWLSEGTLPEDGARSLRDHLGALERIYREHIAVEDKEVFPAADRALTSAALEEIGREMAGRRGVSFTPPPELE